MTRISTRSFLHILYKVFMIPLGVLAGEVVVFFILKATHYDATIYLTLGSLIMIPLAISLALCLMLVFFVFVRLLKLNFLFSISANFVISFFFATLFHSSGIILDRIGGNLREISYNFWSVLVILPISTFGIVVTFFVWLRSKYLVVRPQNPAHE